MPAGSVGPGVLNVSREAQDAWVARVLGVTVAGKVAGAGVPPLRLRAAAPRPRAAVRHVSLEGRALWRDAREAVDAQLDALSSQLLASGDSDLIRVGELGSAAVTSRLGVALSASLIDTDAAPPEKTEAAQARARAAVAAMRELVQSDGLIRILDENTFGVPVTIRATLGGALDALDRALGG